jgi:two-component system cell cycle sensor histidine kinase/response regulator CckA
VKVILDGAGGHDEELRLQALRERQILDTAPEQAFDEIAQLAAQICEVPISLITLIDSDRQWFKARHGVEVSETPREIAFCNHALDGGEELFVVPDLTKDERFIKNPLVAGQPELRFYAGAPLVTSEGYVLGTLCVLDSAPRSLSPLQEKALSTLSRQVMAQIELRRMLALRGEEADRLEERVQTRTAELAHANSILLDQAALLDKAQDAILVQNLDGCVQYWNRGAERLYGHTRDEVLGANLLLLLTAEGSAAAAEALRRTLATGEWIGELRHFSKTKMELTVESRWSLVSHADGRPQSILMVNTDITERKRIEAQFLRAQRLESIGTLASGIAHDLNNVLAPVLMSAELLLERSRDDDDRHWIELILGSARRGVDLIRQILMFARGAEGERVSCRLDHLAREVKKLTQETFSAEITVRVRTGEMPCAVMGDATQLHQMLMNLCVNARDAMPTGGDLTIGVEQVRVGENSLERQSDVKAGSYVLLSVADTGTGMAPEVRDKIFDAFFTTKEQGKGTGLGLATVLLVARRHGGFIEVETKPNLGTCFKIYLPSLDWASEVSEGGTARLVPPHGRGERVLLIDDERSILEIAKVTLENSGYQVLTAEDGVQALSLYAAQQASIAAVITDLKMPLVGGRALIRALRKMNAEVPILLMSGTEGVDGAELLAEAANAAFLSKPFTMEQMLVSLDDRLKVVRAAAPYAFSAAI